MCFLGRDDMHALFSPGLADLARASSSVASGKTPAKCASDRSTIAPGLARACRRRRQRQGSQERCVCSTPDFELPQCLVDGR